MISGGRVQLYLAILIFFHTPEGNTVMLALQGIRKEKKQTKVVLLELQNTILL